MKRFPTLLLALALALAPTTLAGAAEPSPASSPSAVDRFVSHNHSVFGGITQLLLRTAEIMPEEGYEFRPTAEVRTFGEIVEHVAESQYIFCSIAMGDGPEGVDVEETSKSALVTALRDAFDFCEEAYAGLTETSAAEYVTFQGGEKPRLHVLAVNQIHTIEHYGNLVTYLRMNGIVPPTSDPEFMKSLQSSSSEQ